MVAAPQTIEATGLALCARAKMASRQLALAPTAAKNRWLELYASKLEQQGPAILRANQSDLERASNLGAAMRDRRVTQPPTLLRARSQHYEGRAAPGGLSSRARE